MLQVEDPKEARALESARRELRRQVMSYRQPISQEVIDALLRVPRHKLIDPPVEIEVAYRDRPLPIGHGQTISQPFIVALMTEALELTGRERVLEIGTGSGYQAAVLSQLCAHVDSIEVVPALYQRVKARLKELGYDNIDVHLGDGYRGHPEGAPFDRIILTAAPPALPEALVDQLADGGILVAPIGPPKPQTLAEEQHLGRWHKRGERLDYEDLGLVRFVPMVRASS